MRISYAAMMFVYAAVAGMALLSGLVTSENDMCPQSGKDQGYVYTHGELCYQFITTEMTWNQARSFCHQRNGALANIDRAAVHNFVVGSLSRFGFSRNGFWIGLHDQHGEGLFIWDRGRGRSEATVSWSNWAGNEPNNIFNQDCVYMRRSYAWKWVDVDCDGGIGRTYSFACQYDFLTTTTSTTTTTTTTTTTATTTTTTTTPTTTSSTTIPPTTTMPTTTTTVSTSTSTVKPEKPAGNSTNVLLPQPAVPPTGHGDEKRIAAATGKSSQRETSGMNIGIAVGFSFLFIIIVILLVMLLWRRRRNKKYNHSLSNPCYEDGNVSIDANEEECPYAVAHIKSVGNDYVEFGGMSKESPVCSTSNDNGDGALAVSNKQYLSQNVMNDLNHMKMSENTDKSTSKVKFLDEYGPYTHDGYMAPHHLYAEIQERPTPQPRQEIMPNHYNIPVESFSNPTCASGVFDSVDTANNGDVVYDVPKSAADTYDVPKKSPPPDAE